MNGAVNSLGVDVAECRKVTGVLKSILIVFDGVVSRTSFFLVGAQSCCGFRVN